MKEAVCLRYLLPYLASHSSGS